MTDRKRKGSIEGGAGLRDLSGPRDSRVRVGRAVPRGETASAPRTPSDLDSRTVLSFVTTTTANGTTDPSSPERQRERDVALARSLCGNCNHQRNLHADLTVDVYSRDWRGASGPCIKARCQCVKFSAASPTKGAVLGSQEHDT